VVVFSLRTQGRGARARVKTYTTRVTATVHAGHFAATPAFRAAARDAAALAVSFPLESSAEAGSPLSCSETATPPVGERVVEGLLVGVPEVEMEAVGVPEGCTTAAATPSAPLSSRSCAPFTPASSSLCVSVPSVSIAEKGSLPSPPSRRRCRALAVNRLGGSSTVNW
jgi:hypothetical protein